MTAGSIALEGESVAEASSSGTARRSRSVLGRLIALLPHGRSLPEADWARRHRAMVWLVWLNAIGLGVFALARGNSIGHSLFEITPITACAIAAGMPRLGRRVRTGVVAIGLLTSSAVLVHLWDGQIEAHFYFFVMVTVLSIYEEWFPYLLGVAYVVIHHGLAGVLDPTSVYNHSGAWGNPWEWAGIHGGFIALLGLANITTWRMNEDLRAQNARAHRDTLASEERFRSAFDDAPIGMALVDAAGRFRRANRRLADLTGHPCEQLLEMSLDDLSGSGGQWRPTEADGEEERRFKHADGTVGWCLWQHTFVDEAEPYWICQFVDISRRKQAESQLTHRANHDPLTGLPNRSLFGRRLGRALSDARAGGGRLAVTFLDIDDFKLINDSLGHEAGDQLLVAVGERLRRVLRPSDLVARFGGDEFTFCFENVDDERHARRIAERLGSVLRAPFVVQGESRFVTASLGIKLSRGEETAEALLADADAAMYRAKELGKARAEFFDETMRQRVVERLELETGLRDAVERGQLRLDYQPAVDLRSGEMVGVEALVRWDHPTLGTVAPDRFIPVAERTGLILPIGEWVLREACNQVARWKEDGTSRASDLTMSVNVSARQLLSDDLVEVVRAAFTDAGIEPERLCLEVTESAVIADPDVALETLRELAELGVGLAIDDFGIGYSSLGNLRDLLPVDVLKIDRSFVSGMNSRSEDHAIVESVLQLAKALGVRAIAEGVETPDQADALRDLGCVYAQGYHYARPGKPKAVDELLAREALGELSS
ncbi:MAG TPA: EAL domain-containing protein [Thermoleophilaceae bacterium]|nr:EAL domain-containing protein [Thermoleophilaceae bacterium]